MNTVVTSGFAVALRAAVGLLLLVSVAAGAAETPIYRCAQAGGGVLYTEYPCKAGAIVDVHPGAADPRAIERLAQVRAELDRSAARREAQRSLDAARRAEAVRVRAEMDAFQGATEPMIAYPDVAYGPVFGYYGNNLQGRAHRARPPGRLDHHRFDGIGASNARFRAHVGRVPASPAKPSRSR